MSLLGAIKGIGTAVLPVVGGAVGGPIGAAAGTAVAGAVSGSKSGAGCSNQVDTATAQRTIAGLSSSERATIVAWLNKWGYGQYAGLTNAERVAWAFAGGSDCKTTTAAAKDGPEFWLQMVSKYGSAASYWGEHSGGSDIFAGAPIGDVGASIPGTSTDFLAGLLRQVAGSPPAPATAPSYLSPAATMPTGSAPAGSSSTLLVVGGGALLLVVVMLLAFGRK